MEYCEMEAHKRFGRIEFAIGANVTTEFKKAVAQTEDSEWKSLYKMVNGRIIKTDIEWAEICYVPNKIGHSKNGPEYRYLTKRQALTEQLELPGIGEEAESKKLPFPTMPMKSKR